MRIFPIRAAFIALMLALTPLSPLGAEETITVVAPHWPDFVEPDGSGIYMEILKAVYEPHGYQLELEIVPFKRAATYVQNGLRDIFLAIYSAEKFAALGLVTENPTITPKYPISVERTVAVMRRDNDIPWHRVESLRNKAVAGVRFYEYDRIFKVPMTYVEVDDQRQGLELLAAGRIDFFVDDYLDTIAYLRRSEENPADYRIENITNENLYPSYPSNQRGQALADIFDQEMPGLIASGLVTRLFENANYEPVVLEQ